MITIPKDSTPRPLSEKDNALIAAIYSYVNNVSDISPIQTGKQLTEIHRALHGTLLKLFVGWCRQMAVDYYKGRFDPRNQLVARKVAFIYDYMIEQKIVNDENYLVDTMI